MLHILRFVKRKIYSHFIVSSNIFLVFCEKFFLRRVFLGRWLWFRFPLRVLLRPSFGGQAGEDSFGVLCCFKGSTTRGVWYGPIIPHFTVVFYDFINIFGFFAYCRGWGVGFRAIKFLVYALCLLRLYLAALEKLGLEQLNLRFLPCQLKSSRRPKAIGNL